MTIPQIYKCKKSRWRYPQWRPVKRNQRWLRFSLKNWGFRLSILQTRWLYLQLFCHHNHDYHGKTYDLRRWCLCTGADKWLELQSIAARFFFFSTTFFFRPHLFVFVLFFSTTFVCFCCCFFSTRFVCFCFLFFWPRLFVFLSQFFFRPCFCFCHDWSFLGMWNVNTFIKCQYSEV